MKLLRLFKDQKGMIPPIILIAGIGLIIFLIIASTSDFKNKLFGSIYEKKRSSAAEITASSIPVPKPSPKITLTFPNDPAGDVLPQNKNNAAIATIDNNTGVAEVVFTFKRLKDNTETNVIYTSSQDKYVVPFDTTIYEGNESVQVSVSAKDINHNVLAEDHSANSSNPKIYPTVTSRVYPPVSSCVNGKPVLSVGWTPVNGATSYTFTRIDGVTGKKYLFNTPSIAGQIDDVAWSKTANGNLIPPIEPGVSYSYKVEAYKDISLTQLLWSQVSPSVTVPVCSTQSLTPDLKVSYEQVPNSGANNLDSNDYETLKVHIVATPPTSAYPKELVQCHGSDGSVYNALYSDNNHFDLRARDVYYNVDLFKYNNIVVPFGATPYSGCDFSFLLKVYDRGTDKFINLNGPGYKGITSLSQELDTYNNYYVPDKQDPKKLIRINNNFSGGWVRFTVKDGALLIAPPASSPSPKSFLSPQPPTQ